MILGGIRVLSPVEILSLPGRLDVLYSSAVPVGQSIEVLRKEQDKKPGSIRFTLRWGGRL
jgi:hypothetical protein